MDFFLWKVESVYRFPIGNTGNDKTAETNPNTPTASLAGSGGPRGGARGVGQLRAACQSHCPPGRPLGPPPSPSNNDVTNSVILQLQEFHHGLLWCAGQDPAREEKYQVGGILPDVRAHRLDARFCVTRALWNKCAIFPTFPRSLSPLG